MLIGGIIFGLVVGLLAGGSIGNLSSVRLRWVAVLMVAVILRFATEWFLLRGNDFVDAIRLPLFGLAFVMLLVALWVNRTHPGMRLAFVGILLNTTAIAANGGHMPIWIPSLQAAGFTIADLTPFHAALAADLNADFLRHAGPLADILPIPLPFIRNVSSIGDLFLTAGLAFFLFATVVRSREEEENPDIGTEGLPLAGLAAATRPPRALQTAMGNQRLRPGTGLTGRLAETAALGRPLVLGTPGAGLAGPGAGVGGGARAAGGASVSVGGRPIALAPVPGGTAGESALPVPGRPRVEVAFRVRRHPYVGLALNGSFSALWTGQLISLFGDRVHQVALAFLVLGVTNSPLAMAMVFVAATLPNLLLSPIAGAYVDRWNQRDVMIVSDLLRASAVLLIPIVAVTNIYLVYPFVFLITSVSIFFRPARVAILPRIVRRDELVTANSALWAGETFADVIGYPLAGIFVAFLGPALPLAFWLDAATYGASAILIASIFIPPIRRRAAATTAGAGGGEGSGGGDEGAKPSGVLAEMAEGFRFLRAERVLFANTIQAAFAQFAIGALTVLMPVLVRDVIADPHVEPTAAYAFLETAIGIGNLVGGFVLGLVGARLAKGRAVILGYVLWGVSMVAVAFAGNLLLAFGILFGAGIANMIFVIPSQVLFQERTPAELIGRVVSFRFALVFGSMTLAMGLGGLFAQVIGVVPVLALTGVLSIVAGLAGLLVPDMRDA